MSTVLLNGCLLYYSMLVVEISIRTLCATTYDDEHHFLKITRKEINILCVYETVIGEETKGERAVEVGGGGACWREISSLSRCVSRGGAWPTDQPWR